MPLRSRSSRSRSRSRSRVRSRSLRGGSGDVPPISESEMSVGGDIDPEVNEKEKKDPGLNGSDLPTVETFGKMWGGKGKGRRRRGRTGRRGGRSGLSDGRGADGGRSKSDGGAAKSRRRAAKGGFVGLVQDALVPLGLLWMQNRSKKNKGHKLIGGKHRKSRKSRGGDDIA